jgi:hypothetical protein
VLIASSATPPISISMAVPVLASAGIGRRPESHDPSAQHAAAPTTRSM